MAGKLSLANFKAAERPPMMVEFIKAEMRKVPLDRQYGDNKDANLEELSLQFLPAGGTKTGNPMFFSFSEPRSKGQNKAWISFESLAKLTGDNFNSFNGDEDPSPVSFINTTRYFLVQWVPVGNRTKQNGEPVEALKFISVATQEEFEETARQRRQPAAGSEAPVSSAPAEIPDSLITELVTVVGGTKTEIQKRVLANQTAKQTPGLLPGIVSGKLLDAAVERGLLTLDGTSYKVA